MRPLSDPRNMPSVRIVTGPTPTSHETPPGGRPPRSGLAWPIQCHTAGYPAVPIKPTPCSERPHTCASVALPESVCGMRGSPTPANEMITSLPLSSQLDAHLAAFNASDIFATLLAAMMPWAAFLSFLVALYFFKFCCAPLMTVLGALPVIHLFSSTCAAVRRFFGSTVSNPLTIALASSEILSHHGEGKSYLAFKIWSNSAGSSSS
mmetsp:Transcript_28693/g.64973  ORF Transcript_28693/g.64973 Transcript_28693/m.64973 type:complete len:207 (+) Transcript_28693:325-945(+)